MKCLSRYFIAFLTSLMLTASAVPAMAGEIQIIVEGEYLQTPIAPRLIQDRTFVPLRSVSESLGAPVTWDDAQQKATITGKKNTIELVIGKPEALINGTPVPLDVAPQKVDGYVMVPLRVVSLGLGKHVYYDDQLLGPTVWITEEHLLSWDDIEVNSPSFVEREEYGMPYLELKPDGMTRRGIRLGDPISKVKELYGEPFKIENGALWYFTVYQPQSGNVYGLVFSQDRGIVSQAVIYFPN
ncbi:copper amine oxidase N-terminal domain-containing protein [Heliophilum fasciatum]|uniref:Copper amine oxidase-like protein n=1 Tax=Heliophilum fasciatum TaxID=35700 RepID=A0A4R2RPD1_9FIRM|nr:copper amine oxidase N-terminal domain-containing protein [Heliophilum fasciatum]MCW2277861.1 hypothetical protein [Heliophilum fasciatum]TCP64569.1 copper amine oxidase-like protein [Heliophilum fasciatum]